MPLQEKNFAPRVGLGYAIGDDRPLMVRAGFGIFYPRIPQIYESAVMNNNGLSNTFLSLDNTNFYQQQVFPSYPSAAVNCPRGPVSCNAARCLEAVCDQRDCGVFTVPENAAGAAGSLSLERELAHGVTGTLSYLYVHGWI